MQRVSQSATPDTGIVERMRREHSEAVAKLQRDIPSMLAGDSLAMASIMQHPQPIMMEALREFDKQCRAEIEDICKQHYTQFLKSVSELVVLRSATADLRGSVQDVDTQVQASASQMLDVVGRVQQLVTTREHVLRAGRALQGALHAVHALKRAGQLVEEGNYVLALRLIREVGLEFIPTIQGYCFAEQFRRHVPSIESAARDAVVGQYREWLSDSRLVFRRCGSRLMARVSAELARGASTVPGTAVSDDSDDLSEVVTPVLRAWLVYEQMNDGATFRSMIMENRALQLARILDDFKAKADAMSGDDDSALARGGHGTTMSTRDILSEIAGLFIVERAISSSAAMLLPRAEVASLWQKASTQVEATVRGLFAQISVPALMLQTKDDVLVFCEAMRPFEFDVNSLVLFLIDELSRYVDVLLLDYHDQVQRVLAQDNFTSMVVSSDEEYTALIEPYQLYKPEVLRFPMTVPFSRMVPLFCKMVKTFASQSVEYMRGLTQGVEATRMATERLLQLIGNQLRGVVESSASVTQAALLISNCISLASAHKAFDQVLAALHLAVHPGGLLGAIRLHTASVFDDLRGRAEQQLLEGVELKVDEMMSLADNIDWMTRKQPREAREYVHGVVSYLGTVLRLVENLPSDVFQAVVYHAMRSISASVLEMWGRQRRYTLEAVLCLENDVTALEAFASASKVRAANDHFRELRGIVDIVIGNDMERYLKMPEADKLRNFPHVNPGRATAIMKAYHK